MQDAQQFIENAAEIRRTLGKIADALEQHATVACRQGIEQPEDIIPRDGTEHRFDLLLSHLAAAERNRLVEETQGIAHAAIGRSSQSQQGRLIEVDLLALQDMAQLSGDLFERHALEAELQAARQHSHRHLLRIGGREQELHMLRWLFKSFQ